MSKEMLVIALGVLTVVVTQLGIPTSWKLPTLLLIGVAVAFVGFLLRGETISRRMSDNNPYATRSRGTSFVESPAPQTPDDQKNGINSLN